MKEILPESLFEEFGEKLFQYALSLLNHSQDAEEAVQNVFMKLARNPQLLKGVRNPRAYLYTAIRHESGDLRKNRGRELPLEEYGGEGFFSRNSHLGEEEILLQEGVMKLPLEQREVLFLRVYQELSFKEIAQLLGISINTAASRYRYAIRSLKD